MEELPVLENSQIRLRAFKDTDASLVQNVASDELIPLITSVPTSSAHDEALAYIKRQHDRLIDGIGYSFAISDIATDEAVGQVGLWMRDIDQGRANVGYWIGSSFRRCGYAAAALSRITKWGLDMPSVKRLELYVEPWNEGSWRAAEKIGFRREGLLRLWQEVGLERRDMYMYSLLPNERAAGLSG